MIEEWKTSRNFCDLTVAAYQSAAFSPQSLLARHDRFMHSLMQRFHQISPDELREHMAELISLTIPLTMRGVDAPAQLIEDAKHLYWFCTDPGSPCRDDGLGAQLLDVLRSTSITPLRALTENRAKNLLERLTKSSTDPFIEIEILADLKGALMGAHGSDAGEMRSYGYLFKLIIPAIEIGSLALKRDLLDTLLLEVRRAVPGPSAFPAFARGLAQSFLSDHRACAPIDRERLNRLTEYARMAEEFEYDDDQYR